jgi:hypothetical protein
MSGYSAVRTSDAEPGLMSLSARDDHSSDAQDTTTTYKPEAAGCWVRLCLSSFCCSYHDRDLLRLLIVACVRQLSWRIAGLGLLLLLFSITFPAVYIFATVNGENEIPYASSAILPAHVMFAVCSDTCAREEMMSAAPARIGAAGTGSFAGRWRYRSYFNLPQMDVTPQLLVFARGTFELFVDDKDQITGRSRAQSESPSAAPFISFCHSHAIQAHWSVAIETVKASSGR